MSGWASEIEKEKSPTISLGTDIEDGQVALACCDRSYAENGPGMLGGPGIVFQTRHFSVGDGPEDRLCGARHRERCLRPRSIDPKADS